MTNNLSGWLNLYKPKHISSAKFIAKVKHIVKPAKVGHAGTLDPLAEGILPVAIGEATKLAGLLIDANKTYSFTIQFGAKTSSGDEGTEIIERTDVRVTKKDIEEVIGKFVGEIEQIPSKYSAIKIKGERAYKLARQEQEFDMPSRAINIYNLSLDSFDEATQQASFTCKCSKGTYIRTLAEDIAFSLNNLGYVIRLERLEVGKFNVRNSIKFESHDEAFSLDIIKQKLLSVDFTLDDILVIDALEDEARKIRFGQKVIFENKDDGFYAIFLNGVLCAIGNLQDSVFEIKRVFNL